MASLADFGLSDVTRPIMSMPSVGLAQILDVVARQAPIQYQDLANLPMLHGGMFNILPSMVSTGYLVGASQGDLSKLIEILKGR
jgi:hypothetical protein